MSTAQPAGYDQMAALYRRYLVRRGRLTLTVNPMGGAGAIQYIGSGAVTFDVAGTPSVDQLNALEGSQPILADLSSARKTTWTFDVSNYASVPLDDDFSSTTNMDPVNVLYFRLSASSNAAEVQYIYGYVLELDVEFTEPITVTDTVPAYSPDCSDGCTCCMCSKTRPTGSGAGRPLAGLR